MIKSAIRAVASWCGVTEKEAALYLFLSACGWFYFAYQYLYESGLGAGMPKYAGF
jgi:hypothetical protein